MKKLLGKTLCLIIAFCMLLSCIPAFAADAQESKPTVFVIGDSTAQRYAYPTGNLADIQTTLTGWGQVLYNYFKDSCTVSNWARSGESTKRLYNTWWSSVLGKVNSGDYVLIQMGHNDTNANNDECYTIANAEEEAWGEEAESKISTDNYIDGSYKYYLDLYVEAIKAKGAYPILVSSIERYDAAFYVASADATSLSYFNELGKQEDPASSTLYLYVEAMEKVATENDVPFIDVWTDFRAMLHNLGSYESIQLFNNYSTDRVHLNRKGAMETAKLFAQKLSTDSHDYSQALSAYLIDDIDAVQDAGIPTSTPIISEDFNGAYTDGAKAGVPYNGWVKQDSGQLVKNKGFEYYKNGNGDEDFAMAFTSTEATGDLARYTLQYDLEKPVTEGYVKLSFKMFAPEGTPADVIMGISFGGNERILRTAPASGSTYSVGQWHTFDFYLDVKKGLMVDYIDNKILHNNFNATLDGLKFVHFGLWRTEAKNAKICIDDVSLSYIDEETFNAAARILPEGVLLSESFTYAPLGNAVNGSISAPTHGDLYVTGSGSYGTTISFAQDPTDSTNNAVKFQRTQATGTWQYIGKRFGNNASDTRCLGQGLYTCKFRIFTDDTDSRSFQFNIWDTANSAPISFDFTEDKVYLINGSNRHGGSPSGPAKLEYNTWHEVEIEIEITDAIYLTIYVDNALAIRNEKLKAISAQPSAPRIGEIAWRIDNEALSTNATSAPADGIYSSFMIDDIVVKKASKGIEITGVEEKDGKLTAITLNALWAPLENQKFIVAVYGADNAKTLKDAKILTYNNKKTITLDTPIEVGSGDSVKVFYWDMETLAPIMAEFPQTID